jgi:uracil-DNA glycosylase family 4
MSSKLIKGNGPTNARIIGIGEAPAYYEQIHGIPFAGPSGYKLNSWLDKAGLDRRYIRIDNVCQYRAPGDDIENLNPDYLAVCMRHLHERIACLEDPYVLVPMGNYATYALTGKGKVKAAVRKAFGEEIKASKAEKKAGITKLRGSIYSYVDLNGRSMKVIPTVHPAFLLHGMNSKWEKRCVGDWKRIREESQFREVIDIGRHCITNPQQHEIMEFVNLVSYLHHG